jgi:hypothetical protein
MTASPVHRAVLYDASGPIADGVGPVWRLHSGGYVVVFSPWSPKIDNTTHFGVALTTPDGTAVVEWRHPTDVYVGTIAGAGNDESIGWVVFAGGRPTSSAQSAVNDVDNNHNLLPGAPEFNNTPGGNAGGPVFKQALATGSSVAAALDQVDPIARSDYLAKPRQAVNLDVTGPAAKAELAIPHWNSVSSDPATLAITWCQLLRLD